MSAFPSAFFTDSVARGFLCTSGDAMPGTAGRDPQQPHCPTAAVTPCRAVSQLCLAAASPQPLQEGLWHQLTRSPKCPRGHAYPDIPAISRSPGRSERAALGRREGPKSLYNFLILVRDFDQCWLLKMSSPQWGHFYVIQLSLFLLQVMNQKSVQRVVVPGVSNGSLASQPGSATRGNCSSVS